MAITNPKIAVSRKGHPIQALRPGTTQTISYTATAAALATAVDGVVLLTSTTDCHIVFAQTPTATTANTYIVADIPYYFRIRNEKISAIRNTADGTLYVTVMD